MWAYVDLLQHYFLRGGLFGCGGLSALKIMMREIAKCLEVLPAVVKILYSRKMMRITLIKMLN